MDPDTKTVLHGYVVKKPAQMATTMQPTDIVEFHVCNTDRVLPLQWGRLKDGPPCRTFAPPVWEAWKLQDGQLIAESLPGLAGSVSIDALPDNLRALLRSAAPANEVRAYSFPTPDGKMTLGIISKPGYVGG